MMIEPNTEARTLESLGIDVPDWIDSGITVGEVDAILQGGCASGAYMPSVTYSTARAVMGRWGDDVLDFLESWADLDTFTPVGLSWSGHCCKILSTAVELWAEIVADRVSDALEQEEWDREDEE